MTTDSVEIGTVRAMVIGAVAALSLTTGAASAAVYNYEYLGETLACDVAFGGDCLSGETRPGYSGSLSIDTALLPGGVLSGSVVRLQTVVDQDSIGLPPGVTTTVTSSSGTFEETNNSGGALGGTLPSFIDVSGIAFNALASNVLISSFQWSFDETGQIFDWAGSSFAGGSNDFESSPSGDVTSDGFASVGPGQWVLASVEPSPSPVPLPASGAVLVVCLTFLGVLRRRTTQKS